MEEYPCQILQFGGDAVLDVGSTYLWRMTFASVAELNLTREGGNLEGLPDQIVFICELLHVVASCK